jgi:hypothetical protein
MFKTRCVWALLALLTSIGWAAERPGTRQESLAPTQISLEELLKINVISVTKMRSVSLPSVATLKSSAMSMERSHGAGNQEGA